MHEIRRGRHETQPDIEEAARAQLRTKVSERFKGHDLAVLITAILDAERVSARRLLVALTAVLTSSLDEGFAVWKVHALSCG